MNRGEARVIGQDLRVTIHARLRVGHSGEGVGLDRRMTIATVDPEIPRVDLVAKWHRLGPLLPNAGEKRGTNVDPPEGGKSTDEDDSADEGTTRKSVGAAGKNLGHALPASPLGDERSE